MNKTQLTQEIIKLGGSKPNSKATKPELQKILKSLTAKPRSSNQVLRELFKKKGLVTKADLEKIAKDLGVKNNAVETALTDQKNPKWAGGPVIQHKRDEQGRYIAA